MTSSQETYALESPVLRRAETFPPPDKALGRANRIRDNEIERKLIDFANKLQFSSPNDIGLEIINNDGAHIFYFIGRFNPPHAGHIHALIQLIEAANAKGSIPLILLGNGPASERIKNPINFDLKEKIIRQKLLEANINPDKYILQNMSTPFKDVPRHISDTFSKISDMDISNIRDGYITHYVGDKGDDSTKLNSLLPIAQSTLSRLLKIPIDKISIGTVAVQPLQKESSSSSVKSEDMSATEVRNEAIKSIRDGTPFKYMDYYGPFTNELLGQIQAVNEEESVKEAAKEAERIRKEEIKLAKKNAATVVAETAFNSRQSATKRSKSSNIMPQVEESVIELEQSDILKEPQNTRGKRVSKKNEGVVGAIGGKFKKTKNRKRVRNKKTKKYSNYMRNKTLKKHKHKHKPKPN